MHLAASADPMRPAMNAVLIENNAAIATNGSVLVKVSLENVIPVAAEKLNGVLIPRKMWAHFCSARDPLFYTEGDKVFFRGPYGDILVKGLNESFPDYRKAVNDWKSFELVSVGLNSRLLELINKIFENPQAGLRLDFQGPKSQIRVVPNVADHAPWECEALIMPVMLEGDEAKEPFSFLKSGAPEEMREGK